MSIADLWDVTGIIAVTSTPYGGSERLTSYICLTENEGVYSLVDASDSHIQTSRHVLREQKPPYTLSLPKETISFTNRINLHLAQTTLLPDSNEGHGVFYCQHKVYGQDKRVPIIILDSKRKYCKP